MIEIDPDMPKDQVALMLAKQNHASSLVYLLERTLERFSHIDKEHLPPTEADFLKDVEAKVKAAHDSMKDWSDDGEE